MKRKPANQRAKESRSNHGSSSGGFTLIEMLTVVAIIALLAAIVMPAVQRGLRSSMQAKGLSNLRQIGLAIQLFSMDSDDRFPPGVSGTTDYATILSPYLGGQSSTWNNAGTRSPIFKDPASRETRGYYHFSANPNFMPDIQKWESPEPQPSDLQRLFKRHVATRPSEQILLADGAQVDRFGYNSAATLYSVSGIWTPYNPANSNELVARGPDIDGAGGHLRWRADNGRGLKCLFVDGHVAIIQEGTLARKHFQKDP